MLATDCKRDDCQLGARRITYKRLQARYVCNDCGGRLTIRFGPDWYICCASCGGYDFITKSRYQNQKIDTWVITQRLPEHLRALAEPDRETVPADTAIDQLFDQGESECLSRD